jgi:uncharacterized protein (DUF1800 family)
MVDLKAAAIAANRFGYGAGRGELAAIAGDPRGWLKAQLTPQTSPPAGANPSAARLALFFEARREKKTDVDLAAMYRKEFHDDFQAEAVRRTLAAAASAKPFRERLVQFWSNHFTVSVQRPVVFPVATGFEEEAIRPHTLGRFNDMLRAVARHPAMLLYLDNAESVGPDSIAGRLRNKGLNENLAREMLELHTVGVTGGYTQADVTELAKILTGWSIAREGDPDSGAFRYRPMIHQPGPKTLLGRVYAETGEDEAVAAMDDLAARPATARHLATKLARHFVADDPPPAAVDRLAATYMKTGGDLHAVSMALVDLPEIWATPQGKIKTPNDLVISTYRTFGIAGSQLGAQAGPQIGPQIGDGVLGSLRQMGQVPFTAPSPAGWPDTAESWVGPEAMMIRIQWAVAAGHKLDGHADARDIARASIQPFASDRTMFHIDNAPSSGEALALLIASPEFQRR